MNETITKGFLAILFGLSLVVHLSSSLASAQCPFGKDEDTNVASKDQHKFSTYQMCVGFTCPQSGLKNGDSVVIGSGTTRLPHPNCTFYITVINAIFYRNPKLRSF